MDQALATIVLCGGISAAIAGLAALPVARRASVIQAVADWRRVEPHLTDQAQRSMLPASGRESLEAREREADALMRAHP